LEIHPPSGKNELAGILEALEKLWKTRLDERGRIYIPKEVRETLQITLGERIYVKLENDHFNVYTSKSIKRLLKENNELRENH